MPMISSIDASRGLPGVHASLKAIQRGMEYLHVLRLLR